MVRQYPHIIVIPGKAGEAYRDNGIWITPPAPADVEQACRYEASAITREYQITDGNYIKYKGIVYLPLNSPDIENGIEIKILGVVDQIKTLFFIRNQMNCTLYV